MVYMNMHSNRIICVLLAVGSGLIINIVDCYQYEANDAKPILDPKELINYTRREEIGKGVKLRRLNKNVQAFLTSKECSTLETSTDAGEREILNLRKIWSRWSKWSQCSVTCGTGVIKRRRLCVFGRCAPGEFEEQRRPCNRVPCLVSPQPGDGLHDLD